MALDGIYLLAIKQELSPLISGRIEKIYQPSREEVVIAIRGRNASGKLLLSMASGSARIHLTTQSIENPAIPPMFCMLLRKKLGCGRLVDIRQNSLERILFLDFETLSELGDTITITLAVEIMGKYANLVIIDENGKIIDCLKHSEDAVTCERPLLPGMTYTLPEKQDRLNILTALDDDIIKQLSSIKSGYLSKHIIASFEGISPVLAREWIYRANGNNDLSCDMVDDNVCKNIAEQIKLTRDAFLSGNRCYTILADENGVLKDFCFYDIEQYGSLMQKKYCDNASSLLDSFYGERDKVARMKQRYHDLYKFLSNTHKRIQNRVANQKKELIETAKREELKLKGDLISANIYRMNKGMNAIECENFFDENCSSIKIQLDARLSPSQNMQRYYALYRKSANAEKELIKQISSGEIELKYIESVSDALTRATTENDVIQLKSELAEQGYIRVSKTKAKAPKPLAPIEYTSPEGFTILVGRNNKQNDLLTFKMAEKSDIWLHVQDITGSHVIIRSNGEAIPDETIVYAAQIAAYHSSGATSSNVPVDYVPIKFVKKPNGAKPGMVIFTNNRTLYVTPKID